ncbi:MAG: signal peptidase II [Chloroflexota bacterium]|jgi:signal peptidase II
MTNYDDSPALNLVPDEDSGDPVSQTLTRPTWTERLLPFLIMVGVLIADQLSKYLVETRIPLYGTWAPIPALEGIFRFVHTSNSGAVFGLFQGTGMFFAILAVFVIGAIIYFNFTLPGDQWLLRIAIGLQLGGAIGNLVDRLRQEGHVTDFIDIGPWYIFNLADLAIVSGVILFGWVILRDHQHAERKDRLDYNDSETVPEAGTENNKIID